MQWKGLRRKKGRDTCNWVVVAYKLCNMFGWIKGGEIGIAGVEGKLLFSKGEWKVTLVHMWHVKWPFSESTTLTHTVALKVCGCYLGGRDHLIPQNNYLSFFFIVTWLWHLRPCVGNFRREGLIHCSPIISQIFNFQPQVKFNYVLFYTQCLFYASTCLATEYVVVTRSIW